MAEYYSVQDPVVNYLQCTVMSVILFGILWLTHYGTIRSSTQDRE